MAAKKSVQLHNETVTLTRIFVQPAIAQDVGRCHDRRRSLRRGFPAQRDRLIPVFRPVIETGKTVEMQVNQGWKRNVGLSDLRSTAPTRPRQLPAPPRIRWAP